MLFPTLAIGCAAILLFVEVHTAVPAAVSAPADSGPGESLIDCNQAIVAANEKVRACSQAVTAMDERLAALVAEISRVKNLRQQMIFIRVRAVEDNKWPVVVAGYQFREARDLDRAVTGSERYLDKAVRNQADLLHASADLRQLQRDAQGIVQSMTETRDRMLLHDTSSASLQEDDNRITSLGLDLQNRLVQITKIESGTSDLPPFSPYE